MGILVSTSFAEGQEPPSSILMQKDFSKSFVSFVFPSLVPALDVFFIVDAVSFECFVGFGVSLLQARSEDSVHKMAVRSTFCVGVMEAYRNDVCNYCTSVQKNSLQKHTYKVIFE